MNVKQSDSAVTCSRCGTMNEQGLVRIQGQSGYVCSDCLIDGLATLGPDKTVTIDGVQKVDLGGEGQGAN